MTAPNAAGYDYTIAKGILTDVEKDRFLACYLNLTDSNAINWDKAATDFGSASTASFKKMISNACKKITDAQKNGGVPASPVKKAASGGKKRKAGDEDGDGTPSPTKKGKVGGKIKKADTPVEDDAAFVKTEGVEGENEDEI